MIILLLEKFKTNNFGLIWTCSSKTRQSRHTSACFAIFRILFELFGEVLLWIFLLWCLQWILH